MDDKVHVKVTDFGTTRTLKTSNMMTTGIGTPFYMAPETIHVDPRTIYDGKVDVFSYGIVLYEIAARKQYHFPTTCYFVLSDLTKLQILTGGILRRK